MKKIIRYLLLFTFSLITINYFLANLRIGDSATNYLLVALILTVFELILKPIVKILLLPITILTLGLFRSIIDTLGLYMAVFLLPDFAVANIHIPTIGLGGIIIPEINLSGFWSFLATSFFIGLIFHLFNKLLTLKIHQ